VEKCYRAGQATNGNMAHAHCMLDNFDYKHTLRLFNTYCFSAATMVEGLRLNVTLHVTLPVLLKEIIFALLSLVKCKQCIETKEFSFAHGLL
jgi:hypothetical protein